MKALICVAVICFLQLVSCEESADGFNHAGDMHAEIERMETMLAQRSAAGAGTKENAEAFADKFKATLEDLLHSFREGDFEVIDKATNKKIQQADESTTVQSKEELKADVVVVKKENDAIDDLDKIMNDKMAKKSVAVKEVKKSDPVNDVIKTEKSVESSEDELATQAEDELFEQSINSYADQVMKRAVVTAEKPKACQDTRPDCGWLKSQNFCITHQDRIKKECAKTCELCHCKDKSTKCHYLKNFGKCGLKRMKNYLCPATCGSCKAHAPPKCSKTQYKCCWDKQTTKKDTKGSNCRNCKDAYRYVCKTFKPDCTSMGIPGEFMRYYCPDSCDLCGGKCKDSVKHAFYCPFWKDELDWCKLKPETMRHYCPVTCGLC